MFFDEVIVFECRIYEKLWFQVELILFVFCFGFSQIENNFLMKIFGFDLFKGKGDEL